jgi:hypothetical protein
LRQEAPASESARRSEGSAHPIATRMGRRPRCHADRGRGVRLRSAQPRCPGRLSPTGPPLAAPTWGRPAGSSASGALGADDEHLRALVTEKVAHSGTTAELVDAARSSSCPRGCCTQAGADDRTAGVRGAGPGRRPVVRRYRRPARAGAARSPDVLCATRAATAPSPVSPIHPELFAGCGARRVPAADGRSGRGGHRLFREVAEVVLDPTIPERRCELRSSAASLWSD